MDKVEYKIRADEIKALIGEGRYAEAVRIADTIDWKRVKSGAMLCTISDLYKINRRYEESRDVLLMAYDRHPTSRPIVYSLCELAIKMGEFVQAVEYYKEFVRIAPRDTGRYILQYKLYEAQEVSLEERIAVLEEFKKHDYRERWAYELAYLYHRVGLTTECVEECDEMFLWFGEGRYVMKALELKALHEPLSPEQQDRYNRFKNKGNEEIQQAPLEENENVQEQQEVVYQDTKQPTKEMPPVTDEVIREYNISRSAQPAQDTVIYNPQMQQEDQPVYQEPVSDDTKVYREDEIVYPHINEIKEPTVDVSQYNTMNLQETLAEGLREIIAAEKDEDTTDKQPSGSMQEIFFDTQTQDIPSVPQMGIDIKYGGNGPILGEAKKYEEPEETQQPQIAAPASPVFGSGMYEEKPLEEEVPGAVIHPNASYQMPTHFESILSQEYDGQISMAVQPEPQVEQQITGQISIEEYLGNWEKFKQDQKEKQLKAVKRRVADETGNMFADYDEQTKEGLQEKIEKAIDDALKKEQYDKASGRGDWSVNREDVINAAVDEVIDEAEAKEVPISDTDELDKIPDELPEEVDADEDTVNEELAASKKEQEVEAEAVSEDKEEDADNSNEAQDTDRVEKTQEEEASKEKEATEEASKEPQKDSKKETKPAADNKSEGEKKHLGNREIEERVRTMTPEEKELFGPYIHHKKSRRQIINAIDNLSMDAFTGNAIVTGEEGAGTVNLAKGLIKAVQASDSNFSGKVAKITANTLNKKSTSSIFDKLANGALIIQRAADLNQETVNELLGILQEENKGLILVMEDTKDDMDKFLDKNPSLKQSFNVRVDIEALDDDSLVAYAKQYAFEKEYAIDNLGILALHTRISERQTLDHEVTVAEVKDIVDDAIYYAEKRSVAHLVDVIVNKRYDENDMIILREKDFMH
ncbi:tetratricopeptide repeat protein [Butyrivibrio sp. INlla14]|uniref:tetratricopeptide repeat protein n=1 Tax=Butyrivibrio sp. INlla14 TaxID=1520808 RepID=UPI0008767370|nr:hypothetical protein [Butyrivibrio sp. INlla14]SCX92463.1 hypothetical protein SAMN02910371_00457 [Butyrivibrio sp. INlla14]